MCLSSVYEKKPDGQEFICRNVAGVRVEGDKLVFINILGEEITFYGKVNAMDFLENKIQVSKTA